jgi:hypothetical protein
MAYEENAKFLSESGERLEPWKGNESKLIREKSQSFGKQMGKLC